MHIENIQMPFVYEAPQKKWDIQAPRRYCVIDYMLSGCYKHNITHNGKRYEITQKTGHIIFLNHEDAYHVEELEHGISISIPLEITDPPKSFVISCEKNPNIQSLFKKSLHCKDLHSGAVLYSAMSIAYEILSEIMQIKESAYQSPTAITNLNRLKEFIYEHCYERDFSVTKISDHFGKSSHHTNRLFKNAYGISLWKFVVDIRLETAMNLLDTTAHTLSDIAELTGFCDEYHLSKSFKEKYKISPANYRNRKNTSHKLI